MGLSNMKSTQTIEVTIQGQTLELSVREAERLVFELNNELMEINKN